ncbi:hypothetical protein HDE_13588 [Halotydeus destructor]|nr:hypothetical protein HDE_13588 [Halotydeus destructor]
MLPRETCCHLNNWQSNEEDAPQICSASKHGRLKGDHDGRSLLFLLYTVHCKASDKVQPNSKSSGPEPLCCAAACEAKYTETPKSESWFACHRGCRFFSLIELLSSSQSEKGIRASCLSACSEAYTNDTLLDTSCHAGCNHQVVLKATKKGSGAEDILHIPLAADSWAPGFIFKVGWTRSGQDVRPSAPREPKDSDDPLAMMKDLVSNFFSSLTSPMSWVSKSSYTYLVGKGVDGKEKLVILPTEEHDRGIIAKSRIPTTPKPVKVLPPTTPKRRTVQTTTSRPPPPTTQAAKVAKIRLSSHWMGTSFFQPDNLGMVQQVGDDQDTVDQDASDEANSRWVIVTLFALFAIVFVWICGSTIFLSRQLTKEEETLKAKGYVKISRADPEAKNLLSDVDDLSDDEEFYYLPLKKENGAKDGPPTYEEAQRNVLSDLNVNFTKSSQSNTATIV